jgi:hypothetical protein
MLGLLSLGGDRGCIAASEDSFLRCPLTKVTLGHFKSGQIGPLVNRFRRSPSFVAVTFCQEANSATNSRLLFLYTLTSTQYGNPCDSPSDNAGSVLRHCLLYLHRCSFAFSRSAVPVKNTCFRSYWLYNVLYSYGCG